MNRLANSDELAATLAADTAAALRAAIAERGVACLAVSGGRTPERFFGALSQQDLDWSCVTVTLVDERWVPETSPRSNAALVRRALIRNAAAVARFVPLYNGADTPEAGRAVLEATVAALPSPFATVVLGMGDDGHTASFFPGGNELAHALDLGSSDRIVTMEADGAGEPRITFSLAALLHTDRLVLHIEGAGKLAVLEKAEAEGPAEEMPIRAVLRQKQVLLNIYWCP